MPDLASLTADLRAFAAARGWQRYHRPKNLAMALAGEAGELAAEFQWLTPEEAEALTPEKRELVAGEMADVLHYLARLADVLDIDLIDAARKKMARNAERFPIRESGVTSTDPVT
ncbi:nucleotide pyrophosphohydrolase [Actinorhabdospora filicis]|uniref:Nucleotide pyrophosphohydrolase n=1 Tax=Actinorhabdospora filicis TaxID=1785913 RepID=A0A9W6SK55_9ACTN|nr:nucleotide pyrophosphohydrolase [Actinorhabdospora filicis]GLZ77124.1 nucleotide pyrophosphohydrolase [Actinorhabdospora filicis]